ncbi:MAG: cation:proton antiporter [Gammaproteobacteria bacterium]
MLALNFFEQLMVILAVSLGMAMLFRRLQLSTIVAYIVVGCLLGPHALGHIDNPGDFSLIAEFGVAFLLFSIGLEFSVARMISLRFTVFGLGGLQVSFCMLVFTLAVYLWGTTLEAAIMIAGALALSSTAIVTRELSKLQQFNSRYAQLSLGILLFQDLIAVIFLILVPVMGKDTGADYTGLLLFTLLKGLVLFVSLMAIGKWLLPRIYQEVARSQSDEIFVLSTLVIALLAAWVTHGLGLSMALGSFIVGMMLSESMFKHQINIDIRPFKDILLGLFFVTVGMNIDLSLLLEYWFRLLYLTVALIALKSFVIALSVRLGGDTALTALRSGIVLSQAGEFGLALITLAYINGTIPLDQASFVILLAVLSMLASPFLLRHSDSISGFILGRLDIGQKDDSNEQQIAMPESGHVIVGGFGRVGQTIAALLESNSVPYIGIDQDAALLKKCRQRGDNVVYGDCTRLDILESCHIADARLAVLTFSSVELAKQSIKQIRDRGIAVPIIVRCSEHGDFEELVSMGANWVIPEMLEASLIIATQVLTILEIDEGLINNQIADIRNSKLNFDNTTQ